ncbi:DUF4405 domain-containing protein [bacterium]|nr:DUF4405 domain-containing protein [bacterium]
MLRKAISVLLAVSFVALATSGMMMFFLDSIAFQLQMHPVHKIFGILMSLGGCFHIYFNFKPIRNYLKQKKLATLGIVMSIMLVVLYGVGLNKPLNQDVIAEIEKTMSLLETQEH